MANLMSERSLTAKKYGFNILNSLIPVIIALVIGSIAILLAKENPLNAYWILMKESILDYQGFLKTLHYAAPLILAGLAIGVSFKAGLFNMGIEGQIISAGFVVAVIGFRLAYLPSAILIPLLIVIGIIVGMLVALIPAILKSRYNVNEMVVTLLLNYAILEVLEYLTSNVFRDPSSGYVSTNMIGTNAIMQRILNSKLTLFFFIVVVVFIIIYILIKRSKLGFEITAMGKNKVFAEASGMNLQKKIIIIMLISGALAGLAGAGWMMSEKYAFTMSFSSNPGLGWDGLLISLLGNHSPIGILISSLFYAVLKTGSNNIAIFSSVPAEIIALIQALIILFLSMKVYVSFKNKPKKPSSVKEVS